MASGKKEAAPQGRIEDSKELALLDDAQKSEVRKNRFGLGGAPKILIEEMSKHP